MKTYFKSFTGLFLLGALVANCSKDDKNDTKNYLKVGDSNYSLSAGVIENYGLEGSDDSYAMDLSLFSRGIVVGDDLNGEFNPTGQGTVVYLETYTSDGLGLDEGEYQFNDTYAAKTFDYGSYCVNWTYGVSNTWGYFASGTINVAREGDVYEITLNMVDTDGKTVKGYYKGTLNYYDYYTPGKSTELRHKRLW